MITPPPFRTGIIGMGGFAGAHHESILRLEAEGHARLVAACDPQAESILPAKPHWSLATRGVRVFSDYRTMIAACAQDLDILVIPTPISLHAEMHLAGVESGLAVYLEKPPTLDHLELERMIAADGRARRASLVGFNFIVEETRQALKRRLLDGEFGRLVEARLLAEWARPAGYFLRSSWAGRLLGADGRVILDSCFGNAMAHYVHNLLFWAGSGGLHDWARIATVQAELYRAHDIEGADTVLAEALTANGVRLRFALTHACHGPSAQSETLVCEKALVRYVVGQGVEIQWTRGTTETIALAPRDFVAANHVAYHRYLRGETSRPETRLSDCRPFVALNNLAYVSSGIIASFPAEAITRVPDEKSGTEFVGVGGLPEALRSFLARGEWPGAARGWRPTGGAVVTPADLPRFHATVAEMAAGQPRAAQAPSAVG